MCVMFLHYISDEKKKIKTTTDQVTHSLTFQFQFCIVEQCG